MLVTRISPLTGTANTREINMTKEQYDEWRSGGRPIQHVLSHVSAADREFLMSGATPEDWLKLFPEPKP